MKIALTGANGFIGSALIKLLKKSNHSVTGIVEKDNTNALASLDLTKKKKVLDFFKKNSFDCIIHLAAIIPSGEVEKQKKVYKQNVIMTRNLVLAFKKNNIKKFIFASSVAVYGTPKGIVSESSPTNPLTTYAKSKLSSEQIVNSLNNIPGKNAISLRITAPYGPGQRIQTVVLKFIKRAFHNKAIEIYGNGERKQNFIYIDDVARGFLLSLKSRASGTFLVGGDTSTTTLALAKTIISLIPKTRSKIIFKGSDLQDSYSLTINMQKIKNSIKYLPKTSLKKGVKKYINFLKKNEGWHNI